MKTKLFTVTLLLMFLMLVGIASAATNFTVSPTTITFSQVTENATFTITNTHATEDLTVTLSTLTIAGEDTYEVDFTISGATTIANGTSQDFVITPDADIDFTKFDLLKDYSADLTISEGGEDEVIVVKVEKGYCSQDCENPGNLDVSIDEISVDGFGDEDDYWYLLDEITVDVDVENKGDWDIEDIELEWALYTTAGEKIDDGDLSKIDLDEDEEETHEISFTLDEDLSEFEGEDAVLYVRATGRINDNDAGDYDEEETVDWTSQRVDVYIDDDFVVLSDIQLDQTAECGDEVTVIAEVWNIGQDKQDDVYVIIYEPTLGLNEQIDIGDIKAYKSEDFTYTFTVPQDIDDGNYIINLMVYDEDDDIYENDEDDNANFDVSLMVQGACKAELGVSIIGNYDPLDQVIKAGREITIKATLTNIGEEATEYQVLVENYEDWAQLVSVEPAILTIDAGEVGEALITLKINSDAEGSQEFKIQALYGESELETYTVFVEGIEAGGFSITGFAVGEGFRQNWFIWTIAALNILLVLVIIVIAARIARRSSE